MTGQPPLSLLSAAVLLIWHSANYLLTADPFSGNRASSASRRNLFIWFVLRSTLAAALTLSVTGWGPGVLLASIVFLGCFLLPTARWLWIPSRYLAEFEISVNCGFAALSWLLIAHFQLQFRLPLPHLPVSNSLLAACTVSAALLIFVVRGGTYIVRGILDRAGSMPLQEIPPATRAAQAPEMRHAFPIDTIELKHGRLIGNIERLILVLFIANGQYTALAFFFAAKGLIRSKDIESRAWADYLILGSLTSFLIAVVTGLLIQSAFRTL